MWAWGDLKGRSLFIGAIKIFAKGVRQASCFVEGRYVRAYAGRCETAQFRLNGLTARLLDMQERLMDKGRFLGRSLADYTFSR
jgi:hypothetical protein